MNEHEHQAQTRARWRALFVRLLRQQGVRQRDIARELGLSESVVSQLVKWTGDGAVYPKKARKR